ncbi:hypothetical protein HWB05_gp184 [Streptomyces phage BRock]|uniref:Uncharacterized protein n=1 Tax=Streptomyces phage BRock TaxID=1913591 RepID=A0A1J0GW71_9CAUD|nr:hypothetical protein HWB05_gp184 [Streptomyces phage BRock]APC46433.1 hypothetical protein [Streptomyces phage BRock]
MGFKFGQGDRVRTVNGTDGEVKFRDEGRGGYQNRYAVLEDGKSEGDEKVFYEEEVR